MMGLIGGAADVNQDYWVIRNDSGEEIPAYACVRITGMFVPFSTSDGTSSYQGVANMGFTVAKPNTYGAQYRHMFNGPRAIPIGKTGQGIFGKVMLGAYAGSAPTVGSSIGPIDGSWLLQQDSAGFTVLDTVTDSLSSASANVCKIIQSPAIFLRGTADVALGSGGASSGQVTIVGSTQKVTGIYSAFGTAIAANTGCHLHWLSGSWYVSKFD
jgi:hypothetical protein